MNNFKEDDFYEYEEIGYGGEAAVFGAKTKTFGSVAVKVFTRKKGNLKEIENMRKFAHHPNIIQFFGTVELSGIISPQYGYVMKYMKNGSIYDAIHNNNLDYSMDTAFSWILQAGRAIAYLHENNVIHRDIKPANMLLSDSLETVYISDFGLAKEHVSGGITSFQGSTYLYMAPEVFKDVTNSNAASDVFSFAISMWEIITKRTPYDDNDDITDDLCLRTEVMNGLRPSLREISDTGLKMLLTRSWNSEADDRTTMVDICVSMESNPIPTLNRICKRSSHIFLDKLPDMATVLLLGQTGVGKSTFINALFNYMKYKSLDEAQRNQVEILIKASFNATDEHLNQMKVVCEPTIYLEEGYEDNENVKEGESSTQRPRTYIFSWGPPSNRKSVRIIDTPGLCDARGAAQDRNNFQLILNFIADHKDISAICILLKPNKSKMKWFFRACFNELLIRFHNSATKSILFCFTNARRTNYLPGETLITLRELINNFDKTTGFQVELNNKTMFCFDNEAFRFLCAVRQGLTFTPEDAAAYNLSWTKTIASIFKLFDRISEMSPHDVENTICVNNIRAVFKAVARPLAEMLRNKFVNINFANDKIKEIDEAIAKSGKDVEDCLFIDQETIIVKGQQWLRDTQRTIDPTQVENIIQGKKNNIETTLLFLEQMIQLNSDLRRDAEKITDCCKIFRAYLKKHSLLLVTDIHFNYIDYLIEKEQKNLQQGGSEEVLKQLEAYLEEYTAYLKGISTDDGDDTVDGKTIEDIYEMLEDLKKMANGEEILADILELEIMTVRNQPENGCTVVDLSDGYISRI